MYRPSSVAGLQCSKSRECAKFKNPKSRDYCTLNGYFKMGATCTLKTLFVVIYCLVIVIFKKLLFSQSSHRSLCVGNSMCNNNTLNCLTIPSRPILYFQTSQSELSLSLATALQLSKLLFCNGIRIFPNKCWTQNHNFNQSFSTMT